MITFKQFLAEAADSTTNLHMTHADEDIFERGDKGAQAAVDFVQDFVVNVGKGKTKLTVKWDGSPAIFAGWDPSDGKFFVATKGVFNKTPKVYKTIADIDATESGGKAEKLRVSLEELPKTGIPKGHVLQGDLLWTVGDQKFETIDGKRYVTVHPNTLVYAWPAESEMGRTVKAARMGIVWHTTYKGSGELASYKASFGVDISKMKQSRGCWMADAFFKGDDIGFTQEEYKECMGHVKKAQSLIGGFDKITKIMDSLPSTAQGANVKTYINKLIRAGKLPNPSKAADEYIKYIGVYWEEKVIAKVKTEKSKEMKRAAMIQMRQELRANVTTLKKAFQYVDHITQAKMLVVKKLNELTKDKIFVKTATGFKVTAPEGYVCINSEKGEAVKFVDRLAFSHFNFSAEYKKGWESAKRG